MEALAEAAGLAAGVAHRQRAPDPSRPGDRAATTGGASGDVASALGGARPSRAVLEQHDGVGVLHDALEAVLGHHDGDAEVVDEAGDGGEHLFGGGGVERRGRLVEHEDRAGGR